MDKNSLHSPLRLILITMGMIFVAEALVMLLFILAGTNITINQGLLDAGLLSLLIAPGMYFFLFKPMQEQQRQVLRSQQWLKSITDHLPEALISIDDEGIIHSFNPAAEVMFQYRANDIIGQSVNLLMGEDDARVHDEYLQRYIKTGDAHVIGRIREVDARRKSGEIFPVELQIRELASNQHRYFLGMMRDISGRHREEAHKKQVEERIERAQRLESLGVLAGGIAHDFNNILSSMLGNTELLRMDIGSLNAASENSLNNIERGCHHAADLCRQMLAYAGKGKYVVEPVNISELVRGMEQLIRVSIPKSVVLEQSLAENIPVVYADMAQMEQVILNLLTNATEAMDGKEGKITLTTRVQSLSKAETTLFEGREDMQAGDYVLIEVRDTGCGIKAEDMPHLFEPFFTTKFTGRGLGMSAILGILRSHCGGIHIDSEVGRGTTMQVVIPAGDELAPAHEDAGIAGAEQQENDQDEDAWHASGKVLVVDDEASVSQMACKMLKRMGFDPLLAENGRQALDRLQQLSGQVSLVVLDMTMPGMSGLEVLEEIRRNFSDVKVILSTGYGAHALDEHFTDCRPDGFIAKPYRYQQLLDEVRKVLGDA